MITENGEKLISYASNFSFRPTKDLTIISKYSDLTNDATITHIFLDWENNIYKTIKNNIVDMSDTNLKLPNELSWNFNGWILDTNNSTEFTKYYLAHFVYDEEQGIKVTVNDKEVQYNKEITLTEGEYSINGAKVIVGANGLTINAINNLTITKDTATTTQSVVSEVINANNMYYINTTLVYDGEINELLFDFGSNIVMDVDKYVKKGNIYQFVLKFTEETLNQVFGNSGKVNAILKLNNQEIGTNIIIR